ncbi:hypothetical protein [Aliikangiella maris]|uniref:Uncharacterized protein n=2 Tax=Aliikangiella maris TaxID=3162458 RepID=A0ABV3MLK9_9GAMM
MKFAYSLIAVPIIIFLSACSSHYSVSSHHGYHGHRHGHGHVSVHSRHHVRGSDVLGALIVGGVIGHVLTEASHQREQHSSSHNSPPHNSSSHYTRIESMPDDDDRYDDDNSHSPTDELSDEYRRWYQSGKDGKCYLMEKINGKSEIVSLVPLNMCH